MSCRLPCFDLTSLIIEDISNRVKMAAVPQHNIQNTIFSVMKMFMPLRGVSFIFLSSVYDQQQLVRLNCLLQEQDEDEMS